LPSICCFPIDKIAFENNVFKEGEFFDPYDSHRCDLNFPNLKGRAFIVNELDTKKGFSMEWLDFGGDVNAMAIVVAVAVIGLVIFVFTRRHIE